ncbi:hypothetical protein D9T14_08795 [Propionibacterium australiense]|uniref:Uncharacterized protein n=1 Tax=Propionibacterium australiense TaxID=119981 RepID=A0A8B3FI94_9ACTN|nr:hypothetical protein D7U36_10140 [Propionibacterium australiense]RLP08261.1 hypothetical protein D9T14_08795 [Propionibacterium australiense]
MTDATAADSAARTRRRCRLVREAVLEWRGRSRFTVLCFLLFMAAQAAARLALVVAAITPSIPIDGYANDGMMSAFSSR